MAALEVPDSQSMAETQPFSQTQHVTQTQPIRQSQAERPRIPPTWGTLIPISAPDAPFTLPKFDLLRPLHGGKASYTIGRASKGKTMADLLIDVRKVSGIHARIYLEPSAPGQGMQTGSADGDVVLEDLSTNGTFVHGIKIDKGKRRVIQSGDEITFCPTTGSADDLRYIFHATPQGYVAPKPDPNVAGGLYVHYEVLEEIGKGSFATVKRGIDRVTGEWVAIKIMNKRRFSNQPKTFVMLEREVQLLKQIDHPHVIGFKNYFADDECVRVQRDKPYARSYMFIVLEYVNGGDVLDFVMRRGGLPEIARQVCSAVAHLHTLGIAHRDLKPDNLLLTKGEHPICKVTDFGLAKMADAVTMLKTLCGTPKVILQPLQRGYDFAVDAWSIGVIVYSAISNALPFEEDETEPLNKRMAVRQPDMQLLQERGVSALGQDFIRKLMIYNPADRMTVADALKHPWLQAAVDRAASSENVSMLIAPPIQLEDTTHSAPDSTTAVDGAAVPTDESGSYSQKLARLGIASQERSVTTAPTDAGKGDSAQMATDSGNVLAPATPDREAPPADVPSDYVSVAGVKRKHPKSEFSSDVSEHDDDDAEDKRGQSDSPATSVAPHASTRKGRATRSKPAKAIAEGDEQEPEADAKTTLRQSTRTRKQPRLT